MNLALKRIFLTILLLAIASTAFGQTITRGPYLQLVTDSSIIVRWRTDVATESYVRYGTSAGSLTQTAFVGGSQTEHTVVVSGLNPDNKYFYSIGDASQTIAGDASYHFNTAPTPGTASPTRIWVLGDSGTAVTHPGQPEAVRDAFAAWSASSPADLMMMLGDNAYPDGTDLEYQAAVFDTYPVQLRQLPLIVTLGNHDGHSADSGTQTGPYYDMFEMPTAGEAGGLASGTEAYYSFDYGNIHIISLDSYDSSRLATGNMMQWLESDLAFNDKPWVIAIWHHPPYTKGSHNSDTSSRETDMRQVALPILEAWGVDMVLGGHSHSYERSYLIDGHYGVSTTLDPVTMVLNPGDGSETGDGVYEKPDIAAAENEGAVYIVAGSSGKVSGGALDHPAMFVGLAELGSMVLDVAGNRLDATFIDDTGAVLDEFTVMKTPDIQPPLIDDVYTEDGTHVVVDFSERVDGVTAGNTANYSIGGLTLSNAAVLAGNKSVRLTTSAMVPNQSYILTVNNVMDENGNVIVPNSQFPFDFIQLITMSFQDGLVPDPAYNGTSDTYIREATSTTNYGSATTLQVDGDEPSGTFTDMSILLGWDISEIPATATVQSASIYLNTLNVGGPYYCYGLLRSWDEATATWINASAGNAWGSPGANGGSDSDSLALCTVNAGSTGTIEIPLNTDGIALLQSWVDGGAGNYGLLISDSATTNGADFDSSESSTAMSRPKLEVTYTVPVVPPNQPPVASFNDSCSNLDCGFTDTSTDPDGSVVSWSWDFGDSSGSSAQHPNHSYVSGGTYSVTLTVTDDGGETGMTSNDVTVADPPQFTEVLANADLPGGGSVSGTFANTHDDDGSSQSITERESGGRKQNRHSYLVHTWQFGLPVNGMATVHANAWSGGSSDDDFAFSWSDDNNNYTHMFTVSSTSPANTDSFVLPPGTSGTIYIRVEDTDQTPGNRTRDTVFIDHLYILAESASGDPPAAPGALVATSAGASVINLSWADNSGDESGFGIERSGDGVNFSQVGTATTDATAYADTGLSPDTTYWYRVSAFNAAGYSGYSNTDSATTDAGAALSLNGYKIKGKHNIDLDWSGTTGSDVDIYRDGGLLVTVSDTGAYTDSTTNKGGRTYNYQVCEAGTASCSAVESVTF